MSYISEKVAYLNGLSDGMDIEKDPNGKLLKGILEVLDAIAVELEDHDEQLEDISDCVDDLYDTVDACCGDDFDDDFIEVTCPNCGETVYFDEDMFDSEEGLICPNCNEEIKIEIPECSCGCTDCE